MTLFRKINNIFITHFVALSLRCKEIEENGIKRARERENSTAASISSTADEIFTPNKRIRTINTSELKSSVCVPSPDKTFTERQVRRGFAPAHYSKINESRYAAAIDFDVAQLCIQRLEKKLMKNDELIKCLKDDKGRMKYN